MSDPLGDIGIAEGEETPLREILAPEKGDDYITSYYEVLRAIEQYTVHFADDAGTLPKPEYGPLLGVAPSTSDETNRETIHVYDEENYEWTDTFKSVDELVTGLENELEDEVDRIDQRIDELDIDDIKNLRDELNRIDQVITNLDIDDIGDLRDELNRIDQDIDNLDIDDIGDLRDELNQISQEVDNLDINDIENLRNKLNQIDQDIDSIETDMGDVGWQDLQSQIDSIETDVDTVEDDVGNVPWWEDSLQSQIDDLKNDINNTAGISDLTSGSTYVGRVKASDLDSDMYDGRSGYLSWDLEDEVWGFDSSNTLLFASIETQPWTSIEHYNAGVITTSAWSSGTVSGFFIMNWDSEVKVNINYIYY